jgi:branched-chain amino acid transport system substrate-binding protein
MKRLFIFVLVVLFVGFGFSGILGAEEGVTDTEIVLASHMDCSGPIAAWGIMLKNGLELTAKEINEAGGIHGRKIRLVIEDSQYDPKKAVMVTNKIINMDKPFAFFCNMGSACGMATRRIIERKKIPQLFPMSATKKLFEPFNRYTFGGVTDSYNESRAMMKFFVEKKKYTKIGFFCQDDEMGETLIRAATDQLATYNLKPVAVERYKRGDTEFSSQIAKLKKADVQLVALGTVLRETVGAWKEAKKIGWDVDMCTLKQCCNFYVPLLCKKAGVSPEGLYSTVMCHFPHENSDLPYVSHFYKKYKEVYNQPADGPSFSGPIALHYVEVALKKAGPDLTREKFVEALETFNNYKAGKLGMVPLTYTNTDHTGMTGVYVVQFSKGLYRTVSDGVIDFRK